MYLALDVFLQKKQSAQDIPVCAVVPSIRVRVAELNKMPFQFLFTSKCSFLNETDIFKCVFSQAQLIWKRRRGVSAPHKGELTTVVVFNRKIMTSQTNPGPFPQLPRSLPR